jgi:SAM-dependent methyltransferase
MRKLHLGCGSNHIVGWENYDAEVDISKPLPFESNSISMIFTEHVLEHITNRQGYLFLEECYRVLEPKGKLHCIVPDPTKQEMNVTEEYRDFFEKMGLSRNVTRGVFVEFGHIGAWTKSLLETAFRGAGFITTSDASDFKGCSGHGKVIGDVFNAVDSVEVTGIKP